MKKSLKHILPIAIICLWLNIYSNAQTAITYTWQHGSNLFNALASYGTKGVAQVANNPGGRENSVSWKDLNNNLWLFGGNGFTTGTNDGFLNDLWRYDITTNEWTWVAGDSSLSRHGTYGTKGTPAAGNTPGARQNAITWTDNNGNLWLFGGDGFAVGQFANNLNDLWKYDINTNMWTWVSGSNQTGQQATYGTKGVASVNNIPSSRFGANAWVDNVGFLWLFGGQGYDTAQVRYNDLWKYNTATNEWTWVAGDSVPDQNGIYGTQGQSSSTTCPGARQASVAWSYNNNLWLFGGYGFPASGTHSYLDDLWKYDVTSGEWTWVSGTNQTNQPAVYGTMGVAGTANVPGARQMSISSIDAEGNLLLFGGWGYTTPTFGRLNDLWSFNSTSNQWTWLGGNNNTNNAGIYGAMSTTSSSNIPGARRMGISWTDNDGNFWVFGGYGYDVNDSLGLLNDMWVIDNSSSTGIADTTRLQNDSFIYPNPAEQNTITIQTSGTGTHTIKVKTIYGSTIDSSNKFSGNTATLDISKYPAGCYLIFIDNKKAHRLIKR